jgi:hypothetical protein
MTSKITKETYDEIVEYNFTQKYSLYILRFFYICSKKGTVFITKLPNSSKKRFHFQWNPHIKNEYSSRCVHFKEVDNNNGFYFSTFEELTNKLSNQYICVYHSVCLDSCSVGKIVSPNETCAICLEEVQLHLMEETRCSHRFCLSCLHKYVKSRLEPSEYGGVDVKGGIPCPTCRQNLEVCLYCGKAQYDCECFLKIIM